MKKIFSLFLVTSLVITASLVFSFRSGADFGDFSGDADYGGGGDYDYDNDYDYGDDDYGTSSGSLFSGGADTVFIAVIVIAIIVFSMITSKKKGSNGTTSTFTGGRTNNIGYSAPTGLNPIESYSSIDPDFSEEELKEWISNSYVRLQQAWQNKDLSPVQTLLSGAYYAQMTSQLDNYKHLRRTNKIDRIAVLGVTLLGWRQESGNDIMIANVRAKICDFVIDDDTRNVVSGDPSKEKLMEYEWTLSRTSGQREEKQEGKTADNCPNCGAPIDLNKSAICPYCNSVIKSAEHSWVIVTIKGISQKTMN
ncbi:MAG: TIM44-like domain-containing protein [Clostridia bacterium]|nr:TIM44-like domain-containing protein [Clostridia bacterium]